jgi:deazaflavin-dependent oxidoreductase (nitroreductase family)
MRLKYRSHRRPGHWHIGRMIAVFLAGVLTGMAVSLRLALIALWRSETQPFLHSVGLFNKRWTNRLALRVLRAGQPHSPYAVIRHVGRRSGHAYATPVIAAHTPDMGAFIIPLAYGEQVDWYRNIRAAGGCTVEWQGQSYRLGAPAVIPAAEAIPAFPRVWELDLRLYGIAHYVHLPIVAAGASAAAEQAVASAR